MTLFQNVPFSARFLLLAAIGGLPFGTTARAESTPQESTGNWIALTGGPATDKWQEDRKGWSITGGAKLDPKGERKLDGVAGEGTLLSDGDAVNFFTRDEFQDLDLKCEFMIPQRSNAGIKFNGLYEIQIRDTHGSKDLSGDMCGGVYPRASRGPYRHIDDGVPPLKNAAKPAGEWQTLELRFKSPRFDDAGKKTANARFEHVMLNGIEVHKVADVKYPTGHVWDEAKEVPRGPIMLQGDHGPVAFRNIMVRPLD